MATATRSDWTTLTESVSLPTDFAAALMTQRVELLRLIDRPLSPDETRRVAHLIAVLIDTNRCLQDRCRNVDTRLKQLGANLGGVCSVVEGMREYLATGDEAQLSNRRVQTDED